LCSNQNTQIIWDGGSSSFEIHCHPHGPGRVSASMRPCIGMNRSKHPHGWIQASTWIGQVFSWAKIAFTRMGPYICPKAVIYPCGNFPWMLQSLEVTDTQGPVFASVRVTTLAHCRFTFQSHAIKTNFLQCIEHGNQLYA
jgi:hypothetical protein